MTQCEPTCVSASRRRGGLRRGRKARFILMPGAVNVVRPKDGGPNRLVALRTANEPRSRQHFSSPPVYQPGADVELVPIWIQKGHAPQAGQAFVRWFLDSNALSLELVEP